MSARDENSNKNNQKQATDNNNNNSFDRIDCFKKAITLDATNAIAWLNLGLSLDKNHVPTVEARGNKIMNSIDCFIQAIELFSTQHPVIIRDQQQQKQTRNSPDSLPVPSSALPSASSPITIHQNTKYYQNHHEQYQQLGSAWCAIALELTTKLRDISPAELASILTHDEELTKRRREYEEKFQELSKKAVETKTEMPPPPGLPEGAPELPFVTVRLTLTNSSSSSTSSSNNKNGNNNNSPPSPKPIKKLTIVEKKLNVLECFAAAIEAAPFYYAAWYGLGQCLLTLKFKKKVLIDGAEFDAANCFYRALLIDPSQASAWHHLALALPSTSHRIAIFGRLYQQRDCLAQALSIDPHQAKSWCALYAISPSSASSSNNNSNNTNSNDENNNNSKNLSAESAQQQQQQQVILSATSCSGKNLLRVRGYPVHDRHHITSALTALTAESRLLNAVTGHGI